MTRPPGTPPDHVIIVERAPIVAMPVHVTEIGAGLHHAARQAERLDISQQLQFTMCPLASETLRPCGKLLRDVRIRCLQIPPCRSPRDATLAQLATFAPPQESGKPSSFP